MKKLRQYWSPIEVKLQFVYFVPAMSWGFVPLLFFPKKIHYRYIVIKLTRLI